MHGFLGEKIGEGAFSDVHAWAPGQVVKLFRRETPAHLPPYEAYLTRAVFKAGGPAPEVLGDATVDGRQGIVLARLEGPTLLQALQSGAVTPEAAGKILAALALAVHRTPPPRRSLPLRAYMEGSLQHYGGRVPERFVAGALALIDRLPPDERLAHCDLHPANVILTEHGPKLLDWTGARRGGAGYDLACCRFLRTELVPEVLGDPEGQRALDAAVQSEYARLADVSPTALAAAVEAHMPVVRVFFLLGSLAVRPATRERLLQRLEADFRACA